MERARAAGDVERLVEDWLRGQANVMTGLPPAVRSGQRFTSKEVEAALRAQVTGPDAVRKALRALVVRSLKNRGAGVYRFGGRPYRHAWRASWPGDEPGFVDHVEKRRSSKRKAVEADPDSLTLTRHPDVPGIWFVEPGRTRTVRLKPVKLTWTEEEE